MHKLKKGIDLFSSQNRRIISVLLNSLKVKYMAKIYFKMSKMFLLNNFLKITNQNAKSLGNQSLSIADFLNAKYNNFFDDIHENSDSFLNLLALNFKENNIHAFNNVYFNVIHSASQLYNLPNEITPAKKADLISTHAYITVLKKLKIIIGSLPKNQLRIIENALDSFILETDEGDTLALDNDFLSKAFTGKKMLKLFIKESFIESISESGHPSNLLIKIVNTIIKTLCEKDEKFTQITSKLRNFIVFQANEEDHWIFEVSPHEMIKGSEHMAQVTAAMIIFLSRVLINENYLPLDHQLPSFNLTISEKNTLIKRNNRFKTISYQLIDNKKQLNKLENELVKTVDAIKSLTGDQKQLKEIIVLKKETLRSLKTTLRQSEEKLSRLLERQDALASKKSDAPRIKGRLTTLTTKCETLKSKIEVLTEEIKGSEITVNEKISLKEELRIHLLNHHRKLSKLKIEIALLKKHIKACEQEKYQLKTSSAIYFAVHWGKSFELFNISAKVYDALISYDLECLLLIERVLVELQESNFPELIGQKMKEKENTYIIPVKKDDQFLCKIHYLTDAKNTIELKEIRTISL